MTSISDNELLRDVDISEEDVYAAMQRIPGYIDISTGDFVAIYRLAHDHARQRLLGRIRADDLMHSILAPLTPNLMLDEAARLMANQGLIHMPVVNDRDQVVGMLSECDVLRHLGAETVLELLAGLLENPTGFSQRCHDTRVAVAMTAPAVTVRDNAGYDEIADAFRAHGGRSMPVVDDEGRLTGLLECTDFVRSSREELNKLGITLAK
ncbi:MAG: CBS domain-containing protein [Pseudomonadota bacterium]|nr:CBS domain-containing protein [Pseudomonadota bacterium]